MMQTIEQVIAPSMKYNAVNSVVTAAIMPLEDMYEKNEFGRHKK